MTDINSAPGLVGTHTPAAHRNRVLGRHSWTVLRDLRRPDDLGGRIDRIFVGPGGIVVVESARWLGEVAKAGRLFYWAFPFWLALYQDRMRYPWKVEMWQYTCTGRVPGINGDVDINVYMP